MDDDTSATIAPETMNSIMKTKWKDERTKANNAALQTASEYMRLFTKEAVARAAEQASSENKTTITVSHLEKVLPQLMLDF
ncbi:centromere protein X-like protein [Hesseltinella vesiculosa]|uniref:Centromere protein X-like protein n=1 Tax=Hesseltinella vesiculosa TaxID=101127 RepID=A0A1X2GAC2_9FUNG|nr:centromere protein X-like protein [Hesseltinella vesiculosa]